MNTKNKVVYARHEPAHCMCPGLFRSVNKGTRKKEKLDITYTHGDEKIRFWGPEPLGVDDMRVLQGLVAFANLSGDNERGLVVKNTTKRKEGIALREKLELKWGAIEKDAMLAVGSYRELAAEIGYKTDSGQQFRNIRECIERLWATSVIVEKDGEREGFRILSDYESSESQGRLLVALNPLIAEAMLGRRKRAVIDMEEIRSLNSDPARLIHQRLCWINPGTTGKVKLATICEYAWPDKANNRKTLYMRKVRARKAIEELVSVGWVFNEYAKEKFEVTRPRR